MDSKIAHEERVGFAQRLHSLLTSAGLSESASDFARGYNLRADGATVTVHAVRKWLMGESIPTQEKIVIIAKWLNVNAAWLRFGDAENGHYYLAGAGEEGLSTQHLTLINDIATLSPSAQILVRDIVDSLLRLTNDKTTVPKYDRSYEGTNPAIEIRPHWSTLRKLRCKTGHPLCESLADEIIGISSLSKSGRGGKYVIKAPVAQGLQRRRSELC